MRDTLECETDNSVAYLNDFDKDEFRHYRLGDSFQMLTTGELYAVVVNEHCLTNCLVPFWSEFELQKLGGALGLAEDDFRMCYFYFEGSFWSFRSPVVSS